MRIGSFLSLRVSLNPGCTSSSCVGWRTYRETLLLPTFLLHLVTAINILSLGTASLCFPDSGDTPPAPSPSCTMTPQPCMLLASGILEFIYHVSMGKDLRATLRSLRAAQLGAHSVFSLSGLILAPTAQDPQPGEPPLSALLLPLPMSERWSLPESHVEGERKSSGLPVGWGEVGRVPLGSLYSDPAPPSRGSQSNCPGRARQTSSTRLLRRQLLPTYQQPDYWLWPEPSNLIHLWPPWP